MTPMTLGEVANRLAIKPSMFGLLYLRWLLFSRRIPHTRREGIRYYDVADIDAWLDRCRVA
jgi:hypothetical protein